MNDAELRAEVIKLTGEDLEPTSGEDAQKLVADMYATPERWPTSCGTFCRSSFQDAHQPLRE